MFEYGRLEKLGLAVGLKNLVTAYEALKCGDTDGVSSLKKFTDLPRSGQQKKRDEKRALRQLIKSFQKCGALVCHEDRKEERIAVRCGRAPDGFLLLQSTLNRDAPVRVTHYRLPDATAESLPWDIRGQITAHGQ